MTPLSGGTSADTIYGGAGNDLINAYSGDDLVYGGPGDDHMYGYHGNDTMHGEDGKDWAIADWDDDTLTGGADDYLDGGEGEWAINNFLDGGPHDRGDRCARGLARNCES